MVSLACALPTDPLPPDWEQDPVFRLDARPKSRLHR